MKILVTGAAGFIGAHLSKRLSHRGHQVIGVDNINSYYDVALKQARLGWAKSEMFSFEKLDITDLHELSRVIEQEKPDLVVHLAAQAGVRYSIENPFAYEQSNIAGHLCVLEAIRHATSRPMLIYASSSSVYGNRPLGNNQGFREDDPVNEPASLYAATKRSCELLSGTYARMYGIGSYGLRFFTAYGPWGRPDMAYCKFVEKMAHGAPIEVYGGGRMARDFTYIDDIVDGIESLLSSPPLSVIHEVLNVGDNNPRGLMDMISILETLLGVKANMIMLPMQPGDVVATYADISRLGAKTGYKPRVSLENGLQEFVLWWTEYLRDVHRS